MIYRLVDNEKIKEGIVCNPTLQNKNIGFNERTQCENIDKGQDTQDG
jgi:hypothetical protein